MLMTSFILSLVAAKIADPDLDYRRGGKTGEELVAEYCASVTPEMQTYDNTMPPVGFWMPNSTTYEVKEICICGNQATYAIISSNFKWREAKGIGSATTGGIIVGATGVTLIEGLSFNLWLACQAMDLVKQVAPGLPVERVVLTGTHCDHSAGSTLWALLGVPIFAHKDTAEKLNSAGFHEEDMRTNIGWFPDMGLDRMLEIYQKYPFHTQEIDGGDTFHDGRLEVKSFGQIQTEGDLWFHDGLCNVAWGGNQQVVNIGWPTVFLDGYNPDIVDTVNDLYDWAMSKGSGLKFVGGHASYIQDGISTVTYMKKYFDSLDSIVRSAVHDGLGLDDTCLAVKNFGGVLYDSTWDAQPLAITLGTNVAVMYYELGGEDKGFTNENFHYWDVFCDPALCVLGDTSKCSNTASPMEFAGNGCCRFADEFHFNGLGYMSSDDCRANCAADDACVANDIARPLTQENGEETFDCFLFYAEKPETLRMECNTDAETEKCYRKTGLVQQLSAPQRFD